MKQVDIIKRQQNMAVYGENCLSFLTMLRNMYDGVNEQMAAEAKAQGVEPPPKNEMYAMVDGLVKAGEQLFKGVIV